MANIKCAKPGISVIQDNLEDKNSECEAALTSINNAGQEGTWDIPK